MQVLGWTLIVLGGLVAIGVFLSALFFVWATGMTWLGGGSFTEGLGQLVVGTVVVGVGTIVCVVLLVAGLLLLGS